MVLMWKEKFAQQTKLANHLEVRSKDKLVKTETMTTAPCELCKKSLPFGSEFVMYWIGMKQTDPKRHYTGGFGNSVCLDCDKKLEDN